VELASVSETLAAECRAEFAAGIDAEPGSIEHLALGWLSAALAISEPPRAANDPFANCAWTLTDRLARAHAIDVKERPRGCAGQYGGAIVRRRSCWIVAGLPAELRDLLGVHECTHILAGPLALSEGAVWWATLTMLYPNTNAATPGDLYLSASLPLPRWTVESRWECLQALRALALEAV
jgi:hypothetical protein